MLEKMIEQAILASRWLLVPLYLGLALMLLVLIWQFYADFFHVVGTLGAADDSVIILETLALIDLVLVAVGVHAGNPSGRGRILRSP